MIKVSKHGFFVDRTTGPRGKWFECPEGIKFDYPVGAKSGKMKIESHEGFAFVDFEVHDHPDVAREWVLTGGDQLKAALAAGLQPWPKSTPTGSMDASEIETHLRWIENL
jgi:hypothetical protein